MNHKPQNVSALVKPGMICYDCGTNAGYFTLLMSKLVGPSGHVFAFEPLPKTLKSFDGIWS